MSIAAPTRAADMICSGLGTGVQGVRDCPTHLAPIILMTNACAVCPPPDSIPTITRGKARARSAGIRRDFSEPIDILARPRRAWPQPVPIHEGCR
jgi:hypothetical protein